MKKLLILTMIFALSLSLSGAAVAGQDTINTELIRDSVGGENPVVKVKWEMLSQSVGVNGRDDSTKSGAQFFPSGQYQVGTEIEVCAIVTDPDGMPDVDGVYADVFYPDSIWLGPNHEWNRQGCHEMHGNEFALTKLTKQAGIDLFCNEIRSANNNLPAWNTQYYGTMSIETTSGMYDEVCAQDGELQKETAYVYCGSKILSYEDPSGLYDVTVLAQDANGLDGTLNNQFEYLGLTAYDVDFDRINYGKVKLNTEKIINGDLTWDSDTPGAYPASVRNVGNTRLKMKVKQDDMELGMTDSHYNVSYKARVGSNAGFAGYSPFNWRTLDNPLDLSTLEEMDFAIEITKFPPGHSDNYIGYIWLDASSYAHYTCADRPST